MIVQCDHCNKEFKKVMFCSTKCRVISHRKRHSEIPIVKKILKIQKEFQPLVACSKHHGSFTCGCKNG